MQRIPEKAISTTKSFGQTNKQTNVFVKPRTSPFTGGHSSHALRLGPLGGARRTQMRSSALGVLPQCLRGLMLDCARHIGVFDINVRTLFLCPYECNQLAFPHVDRSRYYLLFDIDTFPKFPLATFIGGLEVMKPLMFFSPHIWPILSTLIS